MTSEWPRLYRGLTPEAAHEWARCAPWIAAALEHARETHTVDDVRDMVARFEAQFWPGERSAVVTEFLRFPRCHALHLWLCGGEMGELVDTTLPAIERFAREAGCRFLSTTGREGWRRVLAPHGFEPAWHTCLKELNQ